MEQENKNTQQPTAGEVVNRSEQFVEKNASKILYVVLGILVIAFGIWAYIRFVQKPAKEKAYAALFPAEEKFLNGEDSTALKSTDLGAKGFADLAKGSSDAANLAHAYAGICYYDMGKYQEALAELKQFKAKEAFVAPSIVRLMGDCQVQLGKLPEAAKLFEEAAAKADNEAVSPLCLLKAGRVYEELKQYDKALTAYKTIKDKYYNAPEASQVEASIIRVESLKH